MFSYFRPATYITRVNFYTMKRYEKPQTSFKSESPQEILVDLMRLRNFLEYKVDCDMSVQESVEVGTAFFDITCAEKGNAKKLFGDLFWSLLAEQLEKVGKSWGTQVLLKDFYYLNQLSEIHLNEVQQIVLPRSSLIFEDHSSRIPLIDFIAYLLLSLITLNFFLYRFFNAHQK